MQRRRHAVDMIDTDIVGCRTAWKKKSDARRRDGRTMFVVPYRHDVVFHARVVTVLPAVNGLHLRQRH
jgi:hypothetical protein